MATPEIESEDEEYSHLSWSDFTFTEVWSAPKKTVVVATELEEPLAHWLEGEAIKRDTTASDLLRGAVEDLRASQRHNDERVTMTRGDFHQALDSALKKKTGHHG